MDREPDQEAASSTVTRRQLLKSGAGLALLWSFPVISTIGARSAYASGSVTCDGAHDASIGAVGEGCTKLEAKHALKKNANKLARKFCKRIDSCPQGDCGLVARTLSGATCMQVANPNCQGGKGWRCTGTITSVTCKCPVGEACGCDLNTPCNVAIDCHNSGGACNCWVLADRSACFCGPIDACTMHVPCQNGQCPTGQVCVENCCGQLCYAPCGVGRKALPRGKVPMGVR